MGAGICDFLRTATDSAAVFKKITNPVPFNNRKSQFLEQFLIEILSKKNPGKLNLTDV
jgi:hypothetical protein